MFQELLDAFEAEGQDFFQNVVTGDEAWAYLYEPESKVQFKRWHHSFPPHPRKFKAARLNQKVMSTVFWETKGCYSTHFNSERYVTTLRMLREAMRKKRPLKDIYSIQLHHDNARPHTSLLTTQATAKMGWSVIPHPPKCLDLAPSGFYLLGPMKENLCGYHG